MSENNTSPPLRTNSAEFSLGNRAGWAEMGPPRLPVQHFAVWDGIGFRLVVREGGRYSLLCSRSIVKLLTASSEL